MMEQGAGKLSILAVWVGFLRQHSNYFRLLPPNPSGPGLLTASESAGVSAFPLQRSWTVPVNIYSGCLLLQLCHHLFFVFLVAKAIKTLPVSTSRTMEPAQPPSGDAPPASIPSAAIEFATRMFDAARGGDLATFQQALPHGLPANLTNDKGDTLVCSIIIDRVLSYPP